MNWIPVPVDLVEAAGKGRPLAVERLHAYTLVVARLNAGATITVAELAGMSRLAPTTAHEVLQRATADHAHWATNQRNGLPDPPARRPHRRKADKIEPPAVEPAAEGGRGADAGRMTDPVPTPPIDAETDAGRTRGGRPIGVDLAGARVSLRAPSTSLQGTGEGGDAGASASVREPAPPPPSTTSRPVAGQTEGRPPSPAERAETAAAAAPKTGGSAPRHGVERPPERQPARAPPRPSGRQAPAAPPGAQLGLNLGAQPPGVVSAAQRGDPTATDQLRASWDAQTRAQFGTYPAVELGDGRSVPGDLVGLLGDLMSGAVMVRSALLTAGIGSTSVLLRLSDHDRKFTGKGLNAAIWLAIDDHLTRQHGIKLGALAERPDAAVPRAAPTATRGKRSHSYLDGTDAALELLRQRRAAAPPSEPESGPYIDHEGDASCRT